MPSDPSAPSGSDPTQLARDASLSATRVAQALAAHVTMPQAYQQNAVVALEETIQQIKRIQALHHLPPLPELDALLEQTRTMNADVASTRLS